jgi:pimeloyl-ACP methyl ester carboxylesterase
MDIDNKGGAQVAEPLPIVLVPGLLTSPRLYAAQLPALWQHGPVTIAGTTRDDTIAAIASRILADAPPRFALAGLSMGGYICFEIVRQAPTGSTGSRCWTLAPAPTPRR